MLIQDSQIVYRGYFSLLSLISFWYVTDFTCAGACLTLSGRRSDFNLLGNAGQRSWVIDEGLNHADTM